MWIRRTGFSKIPRPKSLGSKNWIPKSNEIGSAGHELREEKEEKKQMEEKEEKEEQGQEKERKEPQKKVPLKPGATIKEKALALFAANYLLYKQGRRTTWGQKMQLIKEKTGIMIGRRTFQRVAETMKQLITKEKSWMRRKVVEYLGKNKEKKTREEKKWREEEIKEHFKKNIEEGSEEIRKDYFLNYYLKRTEVHKVVGNLNGNDLKRRTN